jgi:hypothetical protein
MIKRFIEWFFSPSQDSILCEDFDVYSKLMELEEKYHALLIDVKRLEEENIETTNTLYQISNSIDAVDCRIDILTLENWNNKSGEL